MSFSEDVRKRRSVRTFTGEPLCSEHLEALEKHFSEADNPYGIRVEFRILDAEKFGLQSPVLAGAAQYIGAKVRRGPHSDEAFGYSFEDLVMFCTELGIGTTIIAGTMNRSAFEEAMELENGEYMPCITPVGYAAERMSLKETVMRKGVRADSRFGWEKLFFDGTFERTLTTEDVRIRDMLELVRWAPSAVNRQPWRVVKGGDKFHFYCQHSRGMSAGEAGDMQKIDLGIAMYHFARAAEEQKLEAGFSIADPEIHHSPDMEYIATYTISEKE
ncbi:MAG: nitroreductase [Oscillospiraceae bacterium]|nr:nitroreductase [Oscillospiraceae bacterium]